MAAPIYVVSLVFDLCGMDEFSIRRDIFLDITANNCKKTFDKRRAIHYNSLAMRDWRNRQTRTFKGRVGDRVSSSLTSRTNKKQHFSVLLFLLVRACRCFSDKLQRKL